MRFAPEHRRCAFTVIELIVVMAIVAVMAVLTIMSFSAMGKRSSRAGAADNIKGLLRAAQTAAVDSGLGSLVRIDTKERSLHGIANTVQAAWHLESVSGNITPGAKSMDGVVNGATAIQQGVAGLCFRFSPNAYVDCGTYPVYDQTEGIRVEAYVNPDVRTPPAPAPSGWLEGVIGKGDGQNGGYILGVVVTPAGLTYQVHSGFILQGANGNPVRLHLQYPAATPDLRELRCGEWHHIATEFDGFEARLYVDGTLVDLDSYRQPENIASDPNPVADPNPATDVGFAAPAQITPARGASLRVGMMNYMGGPQYFQGLIDEPQLLSVAGGSHFKLPEGVPLVSSVGVVHYNGQGQLDIAYHSAPVYVSVGDPYQTAVLANDTGGTLVLRGTNPFPPTGGEVIVGGPSAAYEVITYTNSGGQTLNVGPLAVDPGALGRGSYGTTQSAHLAGETVYFARTVKVGPTGLVGQIEGTP